MGLLMLGGLPLQYASRHFGKHLPGALAVVGVDAVIGEGAIVNAHATVDHDASVGDFAHLGVGVQLAGGVRIGARAWLQAGCSAGYRVVVADGTACAPGTVLVADD